MFLNESFDNFPLFFSIRSYFQNAGRTKALSPKNFNGSTLLTNPNLVRNANYQSRPYPKDAQKVIHKFMHENGIHHEFLMMDALFERVT